MAKGIWDDAVPVLPAWRLWLAAACVPGVYFAMLVSALLSLGVGAATAHVSMGGLSGQGVRFALPVVAAFAAIGGVYGFFAVLYGLFQSLRPHPTAEIAVDVDRSSEPALFQFIEVICSDFGCRPPDHVLLSAGFSCYAIQGEVVTPTERYKGRILTLGCPLFGSFSVSELRAVLAHEFAHFSGNDTIYSALVLPVYVSIDACLDQMRRVLYSTGDGAGWMSIPLLFPARLLGLYLYCFHLLNADLSRLRETRADAIAAVYAGSECLCSALRKAVRLGYLFDAVHERQTRLALGDGLGYANYYETFREYASDHVQAQEETEQRAMEDPGTAGDLHPTLKQRLSDVPSCASLPLDNRPASMLPRNAEETEESLTGIFTSSLAASDALTGPTYYLEQLPLPAEASGSPSSEFTSAVVPTVCAGCERMLPPGQTRCYRCDPEIEE